MKPMKVALIGAGGFVSGVVGLFAIALMTAPPTTGVKSVAEVRAICDRDFPENPDACEFDYFKTRIEAQEDRHLAQARSELNH